MSKNQTIFAVKINDMSAELEIDNSKIKCITGNTVHFEALLSDLRSFVHVKSNQILLNFYQKNQLVQCTITSKHCLSITKSIEDLAVPEGMIS